MKYSLSAIVNIGVIASIITLWLVNVAFAKADVNKQIDNKPYSANQIDISTIDFLQYDDGFEQFKKYLIAEAKKLGYSDQSIETISQVKFLPKVIQLDQRQVERRNQQTGGQATPYSIKDYLANHLSKFRVIRAKGILATNQNSLQKISNQFSVPVQVIVGLWALESNFGASQGSYDTLDALASLAYEGRRRELFTIEFFNALKVMQLNQIAKNDFKSSWAGALGQNQFMPSSYLRYGYDGNHNGKIDIWHENDDVFASIANYLQQEGWNNNYGWGAQVILPINFDLQLAGTTNDKALSIAQWQEKGIEFVNQKALQYQFSNNLQNKAFLVLPDKISSPAYLVTSNYKVYLKWNRSSYFAITNGIFSDKVMNYE